MNTNSQRFEIFDTNLEQKTHQRGKLSRTKALATIAAVLLIVSGAYYLGVASVSTQGSQHKWSTTHRGGFSGFSRPQTRLSRTPQTPHFGGAAPSIEALRQKYLPNYRPPHNALLIEIAQKTKIDPATGQKSPNRYRFFDYEGTGTITVAVIKNRYRFDEEIKTFETDYFALENGANPHFYALINDAQAIRDLREDEGTYLYLCGQGNLLPGYTPTQETCFRLSPTYEFEVQRPNLREGNELDIRFWNKYEPQECTLWSASVEAANFRIH